MKKFTFGKSGMNQLAFLPCLALLAMGNLPQATLAEEAEEYAEEKVIEEILVLGSRIKRQSQADTATPLTNLDQSWLDDNAAKDIRDLVQILSINSGAQNNSDIFTQNYTAGTGNINLRGLGVSSTLVLLNDRRQVLSSVQTDNGTSFVDIAALVPRLAIETVEILKDGASAIYGTDAVAGVINFKTRNDFEGVDVQVEHRYRTDNGSQDDTSIDFALGNNTELGHFLLAASYLKRSILVGEEIDWLIPTDNTSGFGNPGSFIKKSSNEVVADPDCEQNGGILQTVRDGTICRFDFGDQQTMVPQEERTQVFGRADWSWTEGTDFWLEVGYAANRVLRETSPSYPTLSTPDLPAGNPANTFGEEVTFQGRPYANNRPAESNFFDHDTIRLALGVEGSFSDTMDWQLSYVTARNDALVNLRDTNADNFQAALNGLGGNACTGTTPGANGCKYFNVSADPGDPDYIDPDLRSFIIGDYLGDLQSTLKTAEFVVIGYELFHIGDNPVDFALGVQYREESLDADYDDITQNDGWTFLIGNPNFDVESDIYAAFGELRLPVSNDIEMNLAVRHEDYGSALGTTTDPKFSLLWRVSPMVSLRTSVGTSFREPTALQTKGVQTRFVNITDANMTTTYAGDRTTGNEDLEPETSTTWNLGLTWAINDHWNLDLDHWRFSFEDVLTKTSAQAIVNANPMDARVERTAAGTISIVRTSFVNANAIDTNGMDLNLKGNYETGAGIWSVNLDATWVLEFDLEDETGRTIDGAGKLNYSNFGDSMPELRANLGLGWQRDAHSLQVFMRHVSSYDNDVTVQKIEDSTTLDAQYTVSLGELLREGMDTSITLGVVNATDENPPLVRGINGNFDSKTGDPRGRRVFVKISASL